MNLFELFIKIGVDDQATNKIEGFRQKLGSGLETAAKIGTAAVATAAAGITALTTSAVKNYAEYEQLVGGAQLMFGKAYDTVAKNAQDAYKTVQMSQNEYLQQVNGFATGLKTALGGNEQAAAELADRIITAEADIIAATGNTAENVQNAFNGIMKSNFTMLDNLQIGITPTKEGFQEVIDKVNEWNKANGEATNYQMGNLADMQSALVDYIEMQGYAGYASREAANTISGSVASMKSAWTNLVTGLADDEADMEVLIDNFVQSVVAVGDNLIPRIETAVGGVGKLLEAFATDILPMIVDILIQNLPAIIDTGFKILGSLVVGMIEALPQLVKVAPQIVSTLYNSLKSAIKSAWTWGKDLVSNFISGIKNSLPSLRDVVSGMAGLVKDFIGFSEPDKGPLSNFHTYAPDMMDLFIEGIQANEKRLQNQIAKTFDFGEQTMNSGYNFKSSSSVQPQRATTIYNKESETDSLLRNILEKLNRLNVYIDGDRLVGSIRDEMDSSLGDLNMQKARGLA